MAQVTVTAQYVADTASYVRNLRQATDATNQFARELPQVEQAQDRVKTSTVALGAALGTLGAQVFAKATGAVMRYAQQGIAAAKQYEQTVISIEGIFAGTGMSMEDAAKKTQTYLADLRDFAAKTPFELPQTLDAVKRLLSIGYAADDVKDRLLPAIGDIVAALGQPPSSISAVVYAFGQMKSAGRVLSQDLMQIGNALPGFNAKMAIANELFQGDFGAMTKAMESGALDSTQAIDVIITAMTKFGGASGAMARQSQTLAGVMSTFADTVNNALIDGLMPSLPVLSATLNEVMPAVESLATAFAQALGPALIDGASLMGEFAPVAASVIPPIINMVSQLTVMADILMTLSPLLIAVADAVGFLAQVIGQLPAPLFAAIGGLLLARVVMKKLQVDSAATATGMAAAFLRIKVAVVGTMDTVRLSVMLAGVSFKAFGLAAGQMAKTFAASMKAIGVAVKGMMASLGPVGWAIMGVSVAFEVLSGRSANAEILIGKLKDTIDETTGAFTELTSKVMREQLRLDLSPQDQAMLAEMGLGVNEMVTAITAGGDELTAFNLKMQDAINQNSLFGVSVNNTGSALITAQRNLQGMAGAYTEAGQAAEAAAADEKAAADAAIASAYSSYEARRANVAKEIAERKSALNEMTADEKQHLRMYQEKTDAMARATDTATKAIQGLQAATEEMTAALDAEASYDNARKGILDLRKELKEGDKNIKGFTEAALDNRAAIRDAAKGYLDYANSLTDPQEKQAALEEGIARITKAMKEAGIDSKDSKILQTMREEAKQSKLTVDEFAKQRAIATTYGNDVGTNFIDGIVEKLEKGKGAVNTAAGAVTSGMVDAANAAQGAASPAKESMKVAKNFIDGIVVGIKQNQKLAKMKVSELGEGMISALEEKLDEFAAKMQTAGTALSTIGDMAFGLEGEFGLPSQIMESMGEGASTSGILGTYKQLSGAVQDLFAPFLDKEMVPKSIVRKNRAAMNSAMGQLKSYTAEAIRLVGERERIQQELSDLDKSYAATTLSINNKYDALDKAAADNVRSIEARYATLIPQLQNAYNAANEAFQRENGILQELIRERDQFLKSISDGFRKFTNALKVDTEKITKTITKTTRQIVDGISILTEESFEVEETTGGGFAGALQGRLDTIRTFAANVNTLLARGVDPTLVQDFVSAGVDQAGETVAAIAAGTDAEIAAINTAQSELAALTTMFQQTAAQQWFNYGIAQQQAIVAPLQIAAEQARVALEQAQIARDTELAAARAHQETLRLERQAELEQARLDYEKQRDDLIAQSDTINEELDLNAKNIEAVFLALRDSMKAKMIPTGRQIINGIIQGLRDREGALYAKARAIADEVRRTIEAAFQIASPSKVTRTMGQQIADGLALGMEDGMRSVAGAALGLANAANPSLPAGQYAMNAGTGSGGRSVVIREGAVQINIGGSMDDRSAAEIQAIVDESLMRLAREIRRT
jgi:hypothetical protein